MPNKSLLDFDKSTSLNITLQGVYSFRITSPPINSFWYLSRKIDFTFKIYSLFCFKNFNFWNLVLTKNRKDAGANTSLYQDYFSNLLKGICQNPIFPKSQKNCLKIADNGSICNLIIQELIENVKIFLRPWWSICVL